MQQCFTQKGGEQFHVVTKAAAVAVAHSAILA